MQYIYIYIQQVFAGIALNHLLSWYRHAVCSLSLHVLKQDPPPSPPCKSFDARIPEYHSIVVYKQLYLLKRLSLSLSSLNRREDGFLPGCEIEQFFMEINFIEANISYLSYRHFLNGIGKSMDNLREILLFLGQFSRSIINNRWIFKIIF